MSVTNFFKNPRASRSNQYPSDLQAIISRKEGEKAQENIVGWQGYQKTPLLSLDKLASDVGIRSVHYKDESSRFGLGSFKALGGAYAVYRLLAKQIQRVTGDNASMADLVEGKYSDIVSQFTVASATAGNHGRSVAWGAQQFGCRCFIYIHSGVSDLRGQEIAKYGATIVRVAGNYDDSVARAAADAEQQGWTIVSDTSYEGYMEIPKWVMQGYTLMVEEIIEQYHIWESEDIEKPTHIFLQCGVGGMAAAICGYLWDSWGESRPLCVVVEPDKADCLYQSATKDKLSEIDGALNTFMVGLACGVPSLLAWTLLQQGADYFLTIPDQGPLDVVKQLAQGKWSVAPIVAGESATAGLSALIDVAADSDLRDQLNLNENSRVLLIGTEGATDEDFFQKVVGVASSNLI